jgi:2-desacetyl-2-hydroxyethyl bacteriochlorophyllide A dehydrogenase
MGLPATMRAARLHRPGSASEEGLVSVDEVSVPRLSPDQVLVQIGACGICASDLHLVRGRMPPGVLPQILGHEAAGTIVAVGNRVEKWGEGDRVALLMIRGCGECVQCEAGRGSLCARRTMPGIDGDGGQAEYAAADARHVVALPPGITFEVAAILTDAVATPYHAIRRSGLRESESCAIFGLGGLGMHAVLLAKLRGAWVVGIDLDPVNLERATAWGADEVIDANDGDPARIVRELSGGGVDVAMDFVGSPDTTAQCLKSLAAGGRAVVVGLTPAELRVPSGTVFVGRELQLMGSVGSSADDLEELLALLDSGELDLSDSISHRWKLDEFPSALRALETRSGHPVRMVVTYE